MKNLVKEPEPQKTMSSLEMSKLTEKRHDSVKRTVELLIGKGLIEQPQIVEVKNSRNQAVRCYQLRKRDSYIVVAQLSPEFTARLVDRWQELELQHKIPTTFSEALQLASDQAKTIEQQNKSIENKNQLLVATNEVSIKAGEILIREFVKSVDIVDMGEKMFFSWLRDQRYITAKNEPYQQFVTRGYFTYKPTEEKHGGKFRYTLRVTPRGKVWLSSKYMGWLDGEG